MQSNHTLHTPLSTLHSWDREHVWHAFTQMAEYEPLLIERAEGCTLYDVEGRAYLDGTSSLWCNVHGHCHPKIDAALRDQLDRVAHTTSLGAGNPTTASLARRLVELAPSGLNHVFFSSDGASSVEVALKMAFQYWRQRSDPQPAKTCYVALGDAYHGDTLGAVSVGGVERFHAMFAPLLFETLRLPSPGAINSRSKVTPSQHRATESFEIADELDMHLAQAEALLTEHHERIAAFVIEPLAQCAAGIVVHPPGYLRGIRELTERFNVLLIADEVAVGFGRTGKLFACEHEQVRPDFLCLGKGLTGGYLPMAATLATTEIWQAFLGTYAESKQFFHGHTYGGNPLAAAVALASLDVFEEEQTLARLPEKIDRLALHLERLARHGHVGAVRQCGLIAGIELVKGKATGEPYPWTEQRGHSVCRYARDEGVLLRPLGNVIVVMPPLSISLDELDRILLAIERGIDRATTTSE
jgi:adenosylmethionine-8-amino-7-oxononanoate aminotransferase